MAEIVLKTPQFTINAVDLSAYVKQVTVKYDAEAKDKTASGDDPREFLGGLKNWTMDLTLNQDYAAGTVDATLFSIVGSTVAVAARATSAAKSATNPSFEGNVILTSYTPLGGSVGEVLEAPITLQGSGTLSRVTA